MPLSGPPAASVGLLMGGCCGWKSRMRQRAICIIQASRSTGDTEARTVRLDSVEGVKAVRRFDVTGVWLKVTRPGRISARGVIDAKDRFNGNPRQDLRPDPRQHRRRWQSLGALVHAPRRPTVPRQLDPRSWQLMPSWSVRLETLLQQSLHADSSRLPSSATTLRDGRGRLDLA